MTPKSFNKLSLARVAMFVIASSYGAFSLGAGAAAAQDSGLYTADQAQQGEMLFNDNCAECHRPDLSGAQGPALKGTAFMDKWGGKPLSQLYTFEHTQMPLTHPGALSDAEMMPITAYILSKNGVPAGTAPLTNATLGETVPAQGTPAAPATPSGGGAPAASSGS